MDAKPIVLSGNPHINNFLEVMKNIIALSFQVPSKYLTDLPPENDKHVRPYTVLRCKNCQGTGTLQNVDGEYYCRKCVRVKRGNFDGI